MMDLETMSRQDFMKLRADLDKAISVAGERDKRNSRKAAEAAVREHGYTLAEIARSISTGLKRIKSRGTAQNRNPDNPRQTWSGRVVIRAGLIRPKRRDALLSSCGSTDVATLGRSDH